MTRRDRLLRALTEWLAYHVEEAAIAVAEHQSRTEAKRAAKRARQDVLVRDRIRDGGKP